SLSMLRRPPVSTLSPYTTLFRSYIVSALIRGRTLDDLIPDGGLEPARAVGLVLQLLDALACAHTFPEGRIVHRDVKPANVLVDEDRKSTRLNSSHDQISYAVSCL